MKKIIIAPDSFKGTLSACEVCDIIGNVLEEKYPCSEIIKLPIADGGEGTVDAYLNIFGGEKISVTVKSPLLRDITACYAMLPDGTAVIEMAQASGLTVEKEKSPMKASTYGTGQLIENALERGAKKIILGIGGSATTDGGVGCLAALGIRFTDENGFDIPPGGEGLEKLKHIDMSAKHEQLFNVPITVLCDVENPLYGENGAAFVYARQKGATETEILRLDKALQNLAAVANAVLNKDNSTLAGAGAAGGLGFAAAAFLGGELKSGIDCILEKANFSQMAQNADLVITGEGKMDNQSLMGKAPFGVAKMSGKTKVIAVVGTLEADAAKVKKLGISQVIETNEQHKPFSEILPTAKADLAFAAKKIEI